MSLYKEEEIIGAIDSIKNEIEESNGEQLLMTGQDVATNTYYSSQNQKFEFSTAYEGEEGQTTYSRKRWALQLLSLHEVSHRNY